MDYKTLRLREWATILETEYPQLIPHRDILLAHLRHECGAMSEDCGWKPGSPRSDHGLAIGIAQWHVCFRYASWMKTRGFYCRTKDAEKIRAAFFEDHPDMRTHFGQLRKYLGDMTACLGGDNRFRVTDDVYSCVRLWNWNAGHPYFAAIERGSLSIPSTL